MQRKNRPASRPLVGAIIDRPLSRLHASLYRTVALARQRPKAPLCKGSWQNRLFGTGFD